MIIVRAVYWTLFILCQLEMNLGEKDDCITRIFQRCTVDVIDMTSGGGLKLLRIIEKEPEVSIQKLIVAVSPSGVFLQRISHAIAYLTYFNYRESTFHIPEGNTIVEIRIKSAPNLRAFIAGQNTHLEVLYIEQCMMDRLPQTLSKMTMMKKLSITICMLFVLRLDMLIENQNLNFLDLSFNQIRQIFPISDRTGRTLSIERLDLSGNQLERLDMSVFGSMPKLTYLQIFDNRIVHLEVSKPVTLPLVRYMYFSNNLIEIFDLRNVTIPSLVFLHLRSNALKRMPFLPKMLPELNSLDLGENNLTQLDLSYFRPYQNVQYVHFPSNQISTVRTSSPIRLPLVWVHLEKNRISSFNITGCDLPNITSLNLNENRLTVIPPVLERFPKLILTMNGNPLTCDTLLPYKDNIQKGRFHKDKVHFSLPCDTTSSFPVGEEIKICCNS